MSHTPGPWTIRDMDPISIWGEHPVHGGITVCRVPAPRSNDSAMADARLIAEAPALLEALWELWQDVAADCDYHESRGDDPKNCAACRAREVLRRCEGEK